MKKKSFLSLFSLFIFSLLCTQKTVAKVGFVDPCINDKDEVLVTVKSDIQGSPCYDTAILMNVKDYQKQYYTTLSCYPEQILLLNAPNALHIQNRYGAFRYNFDTDRLIQIKLSSNIPTQAVSTGLICSSPDGKWLCYIKKTSLFSGALVLQDTLTLKEVILDRDTQFNYNTIPVKWSPDSKALLYQTKDGVYFATVKTAFDKITLGQAFTKITQGTINSTNWADSKAIICINGSNVYKIAVSGLYTRGLYGALASTQDVIGLLAFNFDSHKDSFYCNTTGTKLVIINSNKTISLNTIDTQKVTYINTVFLKPFATSQGVPYDFSVLWTPLDAPILCSRILTKDNFYIYNIYTISFAGGDIKQVLNVEGAKGFCFNPAMTKVAFATNECVKIFDTSTWKEQQLPFVGAFSVLWKKDDTMIAIGSDTVSLYNILQPKENCRVLFLSSCKKAFYIADKTYLLTPQDKLFLYKKEEKKVLYVQDKTAEQILSLLSNMPMVQNGRYRVFTGVCSNTEFFNTVYIRSVSGSPVTKSVFPQTQQITTKKPQIALVFDATDLDAGVDSVLFYLAAFGLKSTFFVSGDFLRQHLQQVKNIIKMGHNGASMFYTTAPFIKNYANDKDFITAGLARLEDEYFSGTGGKEVSLFWHLPYYPKYDFAKQAGNAAGYTYIDAFCHDIKQDQNLNTANIIEKYLKNLKDGSVISVDLSDPLCFDLPLLISAVLESGYEILSLETLLVR